MSRRVVITGTGPISACGLGIEPLWEALLKGDSQIRPISTFDASGFSSNAAAAIQPDAFNIRDVVPKNYRKALKVMCRDVELAIGAAAAAVSHAGIVTKAVDATATPTIEPTRLGCQIGAGLIAADLDELTAALSTSRNEEDQFDLAAWGQPGMGNLTPLWLLKYLPNMLACHVTIVHDCRGPSNTITCCEASGLLSIGESLRVIERNSAEACLTGGVESKLNPMALLRQHFAKRVAPTPADKDPKTILSPFAPDASGTVLGEGGALIVVEALDSALSRKATVRAEINGFAATQSHAAERIGLGTNPSHQEVTDAMAAALNSAGRKPDEIDAVFPLGSGIRGVDEAEATSIDTIFGARSKTLPVIPLTTITGNCGAGHSALVVAVATAALESQKLPARINTVDSDGINATIAPACDHELNHVLVTTCSQGGQNAAIVLSRPEIT